MYDIFMQLLQERGLTPYRVSMDTGIPQSTLSAWKRGKSTPKLNKLQIIADYLGVSVDYLLGENGKKISLPLTIGLRSYCVNRI